MSGQCFSCASSFGTFKKEFGCKNCGFAFCKKCLTKKFALPQHNNAKLPVCNKCYNILTGKIPTVSQTAVEPPDAYYKRLAALQAAQQQQQQIATAAPVGRGAAPKAAGAAVSLEQRISDKYRGLSKEDLAMAQRLERLKEDTKPVNVPSQTEIEARLERLKQVEEPSLPPAACTDNALAGRLAQIRGQNPATVNQPFVFRTDRRTQQEQIDALLEEIGDEVDLQARLNRDTDPVTDIQDRLNKLKSNGTSANSNENDIGRASSNVRPGSQPAVGSTATDLNIPVDSDPSVRPTEPTLEDIERLMHEVASEMQIDAERAIEGLKKDKDLWNRVLRLSDGRRKDGGDGSAMDIDDDAASCSENEDEETATKRVLQQLMEESRLEDEMSDGLPVAAPAASSSTSSSVSPANKSRASPAHPSTSSKRRTTGKTKSVPGVPAVRENPVATDNEELPWCCICNNDATLRCTGCDGDLYCLRCYREGHDRYEMHDHPTVKYAPPPASGR